MDYYRRKAMAQDLAKKLLKQKRSDKDIIYAIEDKFQLSPNWTEKYLERQRE